MDEKIQYRHVIRPQSGNPFTLAFISNGESWRFGVSICSKKDQYSRVVGRRISESRLFARRMKAANQVLLNKPFPSGVVHLPSLRGNEKRWEETVENIKKAVSKIVESRKEECEQTSEAS